MIPNGKVQQHANSPYESNNRFSTGKVKMKQLCYQVKKLSQQHQAGHSYDELINRKRLGSSASDKGTNDTYEYFDRSLYQ